MEDTGGNIKVMLRVRPFNAKEIERGGESCLNFIDGQTVKIKFSEEQEKSKSAEQIPNFNFDKVFNLDTKQSDIFEHAAKPVIQQVFEGFNGTIFAYGQTSSGKTHTMQGPSIDDAEHKGIIPRMVDMVFQNIYESPEHIEYRIKVSIVEIYMEKIRDLLNIQNQNLQVREDKEKGIYIQDVTESYVSEEADVYQLIEYGNNNRSVGYTNMNAGSSRSHMMFILTMSQSNTKDMSSVTGKLCLIDLAGSEKIEKTGAQGQTLEEAKLINKSLSELGNVINALTEKTVGHIPYRNSKLTRVLQESLGGNARTTLIITASPSPYNELETLSTLRFGSRAKSIKNKAKINKEWTVQELQILLKDSETISVKRQGRILKLEDFIRTECGQEVPEGELKADQSKKNVQQQKPQTSTRVVTENDEEGEIKELKEQIQSLEDELKSERQIFEQKDIQFQKMTIEHASAKEELLRLQDEEKENKQVQEKNSQLTMQLAETEDMLKEKDETLEQFETDIAELTQSLKKEQQEKEKLVEEIQEQTNLITKLQIQEPLVSQDNLNNNKNADQTSSILAQVQAQMEQFNTQMQEKDKFIYDYFKNPQKQENPDIKEFLQTYEQKAANQIQLNTEQIKQNIEQDKEQQQQQQQNQSQIKDGSNNSQQQQNLGEDIENKYQQQISDLKNEITNFQLTIEAGQEKQSKLEEKIKSLETEITKSDQRHENMVEEQQKLENVQYITLEEFQKFEQEAKKKELQAEKDLAEMVERNVQYSMKLSEEKHKFEKFEQNLSQSKKVQKNKLNQFENNLQFLTKAYHELLQQSSTWKQAEQISISKLKRKNDRIIHLENNVKQSKEQILIYKKKYDQVSKQLDEIKQQRYNQQQNQNNENQSSPMRGYMAQSHLNNNNSEQVKQPFYPHDRDLSHRQPGGINMLNSNRGGFNPLTTRVPHGKIIMPLRGFKLQNDSIQKQ